MFLLDFFFLPHNFRRRISGKLLPLFFRQTSDSQFVGEELTMVVKVRKFSELTLIVRLWEKNWLW
ncbi:hypothetical protein Lalb_Chr13g0293511 [Lupinus albus]|uniref:Uncharacterized protein n=1 Tax=Lupinus albus TaxID=3870 RepID=A0A6A4PHU6_LUPAL|nr:hypothetical protein Lalb_Chr13g0293511 [Lupinus albus]